MKYAIRAQGKTNGSRAKKPANNHWLFTGSVLRTPALRVADPPLCSLSVSLLISEFHCVLGGAEMGAAIQAHADASDVGMIVKSIAQQSL